MVEHVVRNATQKDIYPLKAYNLLPNRMDNL